MRRERLSLSRHRTSSPLPAARQEGTELAREGHGDPQARHGSSVKPRGETVTTGRPDDRTTGRPRSVRAVLIGHGVLVAVAVCPASPGGIVALESRESSADALHHFWISARKSTQNSLKCRQKPKQARPHPRRNGGQAHYFWCARRDLNPLSAPRRPGLAA